MIIFQAGIASNFLCQNCQQYKIPVYQRNYKWPAEQCTKLFNDIVFAAQRNQLHFCGSIVFQPLTPIKGINVNIIIDGQQRLTTIYILMKALLDMAANPSEKMLPENALFNKDQYGQYNLDDTTKVKLKPAKDNNDQLLKLLYNKHDEISKDCDIYQNYLLFCELIKKEQSRGVTVADIYRGISLLTVAVIQLDGNDKAQEIFERINSTGVLLNISDKIRNYVLMTDIDQDKLYEDYWLKIEELLPEDQLSNFFIDYLNSKVEGFVKESNGYEVFKEVFRKEKYTNEAVLSELLHYAEFYHAFLYEDTKYSPEINSLLQSIHKLKQTTVFLFLFKVFDDYHDGIIDAKELEKVLRLLLNYSIRRVVCEVGSNSLRGLYKTFYSRIFGNVENKKHYYDAILSFLNQLSSKDVMPSDQDFMIALKENNLYRKNALCKYLLAAVENNDKAQVTMDNMTIEHILPQNKNLSTAWQKMLGSEWEIDRNKYLHTLGNLTLTAYNSEIGDKPFEEKKKYYDDKVAKTSVLNEDVKDCQAWNKGAIETRADNLIKKILDIFKVTPVVNTISFADNRFKEYSCENSDDATNKVPNYYVLLGERVNVKEFSEMFYSVSKKLYDLNSSIIINMAKNNERLDVESTSAMFSYDAEKVKGHNISKNRTLDGQIYISSNFSAKKIITTIKQLLGKYNIEENEFYYSAMNKTGYVKASVDKKTESLGGKYAPLGEYLLTVEEDEFVLGVEELESILKFKLPNSFYKHVEFTTTSHNIGDVAYASGFKTHRTKEDMEHVRFTKIDSFKNDPS